MRPEISANIDAVPRFCPSCGQGPRDDEDGKRLLCGHCGEALRPRGYCPICERYLLQEVGTPCPKHDVSLEENDGAPSLSRGGGPFRWVTLRAFSDGLAAEAARIRLEAEGVPTFVEGERTGAPAFYGVPTGVKLQVPAELVGQARILLDQRWAAPIDDLGRDGFGGDWDENDDPDDEPPVAPEAESAVWFWIALAVELVLWTSPLLIGLAIYLWRVR